MKKIFKSFLTITAISFCFIACDEEETNYTPLNYPTDAFVAFDGESIDVNEFTTNDIVVTVNLATVNQAENVTVDFSISSPDAILGTHYEVVDNKTQFSIASGEYSDSVIIKLIDNPDSEPNKAITLTLTGNNSGIKLGYPGPDSNGSTFTVNIIDDDCEKEESLRPFSGSYSGTDSCGDYSVTASLDLACIEGITIKGIGYPWLEGSYWGEVVIGEFDVFVTIDDVAGTVNIPKQRYVTTSYGSTISDYFLVGSGTIDTSGASPVIHLVYDMTHDSYGSMAIDYGGSSCAGLFEADITLD